MVLPVNIEDILNSRTIESDRIEFKEGWNPDAIYRTICAFANDFDNSGGGYILIGVKEENKIAKRPVKGLTSSEIATIQEKMIGFNNLLRPAYHPKLFIEGIDETQIIVLWVPGGSNRPYDVPDNVTKGKVSYNYRIRKYSNSIIPTQQEKTELLSLANQIPFDDRSNTQASIEDISYVLLNEFLRVTRSKLAEIAEINTREDILERMELTAGPAENLFPRNVSLMLFTERPDQFFPYSRIEIVHFPRGAGHPEFIEAPHITGPVNSQITKALEYLKTNLLQEKVRKVSGKSESLRIWNYPYRIFEEAIANALYHRDYAVREPVEIRIFPESVIILNYGGPDRSIKMKAFEEGIIKARRYRNRRLGDFLKELHLTEGKATGIPTIRKALMENGSPPAHFETDADRSFFMVEFNIHPAFKKLLITEKLVKPDNLEDINELIEWIIYNYSDIRLEGLTGESKRTSNEVGNEVNIREFDSNIDANTLIISFIESLRKNDILISNEIINGKSIEVSNEVSNQLINEIHLVLKKEINERTLQILRVCTDSVSLEELLKRIGLSKQTKHFNNYVKPILEMGWIKQTDPLSKTSPHQRYILSLKGKMVIELDNYMKPETD